MMPMTFTYFCTWLIKLLRGCLSASAYIGCENTFTGAMGLRMRRVNRLDRACAVFYRQLSDISVAVRH